MDPTLSCELCHHFFSTQSSKRKHLLSPVHQFRQSKFLDNEYNRQCHYRDYGLPLHNLLFSKEALKARKVSKESKASNNFKDRICFICSLIFPTPENKYRHINKCHERWIEHYRKGEHGKVAEASEASEVSSSKAGRRRKGAIEILTNSSASASTSTHSNKSVSITVPQLQPASQLSTLLMTPSESLSSRKQLQHWCTRCMISFSPLTLSQHTSTPIHISHLPSCRYCGVTFSTSTSQLLHCCPNQLEEKFVIGYCTAKMKGPSLGEKEWRIMMDPLETREMKKEKRGCTEWCGTCKRTLEGTQGETKKERWRNHRKESGHVYTVGEICGEWRRHMKEGGYRDWDTRDGWCWKCWLPR